MHIVFVRPQDSWSSSFRRQGGAVPDRSYAPWTSSRRILRGFNEGASLAGYRPLMPARQGQRMLLSKQTACAKMPAWVRPYMCLECICTYSWNMCHSAQLAIKHVSRQASDLLYATGCPWREHIKMAAEGSLWVQYTPCRRSSASLSIQILPRPLTF